MSQVDDQRALVAKARYIAEVNDILQPMTFSPEGRAVARQLLTDLVQRDDLTQLRGSADEWFNLITYAGRVRHTTAEHSLLTAALEAHPQDVDLLCTSFQFQFGHDSVANAIEAQKRLEDVGEDNAAPYWRYWSYNALFVARYLNDKVRAIGYLNRGLAHVTPADLLNIYRHYRTVLLDGSILPSKSDDSSITDYAHLVKLIEDKYREGLALGIETGYVLAVELARLLRERAAGLAPAEAGEILDSALEWLDVAERSYTHDTNHPIDEIYLEKAITLMARRRYADALQLFRSLPSYSIDESVKVMARYAANMTGQVFDAEPRQSQGGESENLTNRIEQLEEVVGYLARRIQAADQSSGG